MLLNILLIIVGMVSLIAGAEVLVRGALSIARSFGVSGLVIGLTVVSFGTSLPELFVNIIASFQGSADLALGNILGSNIANIMLILAMTALITPIIVQSRTVRKELPFALLGAVLILILGNGLIGGDNVISRYDGALLLSLFAVFMLYIWRLIKAEKVTKNAVEARIQTTHKKSIAWVMVFLGVVGLAIGGELLVTNASTFAEMAGLSEALIGIVIIGIGTSLPELAASIVAARKKQVDMAVGNIIGSNIFNIFWVVGLSAVINPLSYNPSLNIDAGVGVIAVCILLLVIKTGKYKLQLERSEAALLLLLFAAYLVFLFIRG